VPSDDKDDKDDKDDGGQGVNGDKVKNRQLATKPRRLHKEKGTNKPAKVEPTQLPRKKKKRRRQVFNPLPTVVPP
jgi:hypothetical protein